MLKYALQCYKSLVFEAPNCVWKDISTISIQQYTTAECVLLSDHCVNSGLIVLNSLFSLYKKKA